MELVDDICNRIFGLLPTIQAARCAFVCKKWRDLVMHPLVWQTVEVSLVAKNASSRDNDGNESAQLASLARTMNFFQFFPKIGSSIVDLNLEVQMLNTNEELSSTLDAIFQIPSLQRFRCKFAHAKRNVTLGGIARATLSARTGEYRSTLVPACKDLKLLNLPESGVLIFPITYRTLLSGLPNLEEFYPGPCMMLDSKWFLNTQKLQRLSLCSYANVPDLHKIIDTCPSLQYVILRDEESLDESDVDLLTDVAGCSKLKKYKNTYVVFATIFNDPSTLTKQHLDILKPLFTPYNVHGHSYLSCVVGTSGTIMLPPTLKFFMNEMHYDINARDIPEFCYRPSFCYTDVSLNNRGKFPIEESVHDLNKLKTLIDLGATIEIPETSLFIHIEDVDVALTLLQKGADPKRIVTVENETCPAYIPLLNSLRTEDTSVLVHELEKRGCDLKDPRLNK